MIKSNLLIGALILGICLSQSAYSNDSNTIQLKCKGRLTGQYLGGFKGDETRDEKVSFGVTILEGAKQLRTDLNALTKPVSAFKCDLSNSKLIACSYRRESKQTLGKPLRKEWAGTEFDFTGESLVQASISIDRVTGVMSYSGDSTWIQTEPKQIAINTVERGTFECEKGLSNKF